jgi:hypothetical protein
MTIPATQQARVFYSYEIQLAGGIKIGTLQEFSPSARKTVERVRQISAETETRVLEIVPGIVDFSITVSKLMLFKENLLQALGFVPQSLEDIRAPFDIYEICKYPDGTEEKTIYHGCQIESYDYTISTRETLITERCTIQVAWVERVKD